MLDCHCSYNDSELEGRAYNLSNNTLDKFERAIAQVRDEGAI